MKDTPIGLIATVFVQQLISNFYFILDWKGIRGTGKTEETRKHF